MFFSSHRGFVSFFFKVDAVPAVIPAKTEKKD